MPLKRAATPFWAFATVMLLCSFDGQAQERAHVGRPQWRTYDTRDTGAARTTHEAYVDSRGIVFAANDAGLISFDGARWRLLEIGASRRAIHALEPLNDQSWLVGGPGTLGVISIDATGKRTWTEHAPPLEDMEDTFTDTVLRIHRTPDDLLILTDRSILRWAEGRLSEIQSGSPTDLAFNFDDGAILGIEGGLVRLRDGVAEELMPPPGWQELEPRRVLKTRGGSAILVTRRSGLFSISVEESRLRLAPLWESLPPPLDTTSITSAALYSDDSYVLGSEDGSLIHLGADGEQRLVLDERSGIHIGPIRSIVPLSDDSVMAFYDGGMIWLDLSNNIRLWDSENGLTAPVTAIAVDGAATLAGTPAGLFRSLSGHRMIFDTSTGPEPILTLNRFSRSTIRGHTSLLIGRPNGLFDFFDNRLDPITSESPNTVHVSKTQPSRVAVASRSGITLIEFENGVWRDVGKLSGMQNTDATSLTETSDGRLFVALSDGTVLNYNADHWLAETIDPNEGPEIIYNPARHPVPDVEPIFSGRGDDIHYLLPGAPMVWNPRLEQFEVDVDLSTQLEGRIPQWFSSGRSREAVWMQSNQGSFVYQPRMEDSKVVFLTEQTFGTAETGAVFIDDANNQVLFGTPNGIAEVPSTIATDDDPDGPLPILNIRGISVDGERIYAGYGSLDQIHLRSSKTEIEIEVSALRRDLKCNDTKVSVHMGENRAAEWPMDSLCRIMLTNFVPDSKQAPISLTLIRNGKVISQPATLHLSFSSPWFTSWAVPLVAGLAVALTAVIGGSNRRRLWPEPVRRYLALYSGLLFGSAGGLANGLITPGDTGGLVAAQLMGLAGFALFLPLVVKGLIGLSERRAFKSRQL